MPPYFVDSYFSVPLFQGNPSFPDLPFYRGAHNYRYHPCFTSLCPYPLLQSSYFIPNITQLLLGTSGGFSHKPSSHQSTVFCSSLPSHLSMPHWGPSTKCAGHQGHSRNFFLRSASPNKPTGPPDLKLLHVPGSRRADGHPRPCFVAWAAHVQQSPCENCS